MERATKVIIPLLAVGIGFDAMFYLVGMMISTFIEVWTILGIGMVLFYLYLQIDIDRARTQKGIDTDALNYLWVPASIPFIVIAVLLFGTVIRVPFFTFTAFLISAAAVAVVGVVREWDHPGWVASHLDRETRKMLTEDLVTGEVMKGEGAREVAYSFAVLGVAVGGLLAGIFSFLLSSFTFYYFIIFFAGMAAAWNIFIRLGIRTKRSTESCIDGKPLL